MWDNEQQKNDPGQEPALIVKRLRPARRQVSARWLTGTVLTESLPAFLWVLHFLRLLMNNSDW